MELLIFKYIFKLEALNLTKCELLHTLETLLNLE